MTGAQLKILKVLSSLADLEPPAIALHVWPKTTQHEKKTKTVIFHLKKMGTRGWVNRDAEHRYCISDRGRNQLAIELADRAQLRHEAITHDSERLKNILQCSGERTKLTPSDFAGFPRLAQ